MTALATTLHTEELALLYAICREPDDDTPRLVYADWLDETGEGLLQAFAAFIRQSIQDVRFPPIKLVWASGRQMGSEVNIAGMNAKAALLASTSGSNQNGNAWAYRLFGFGVDSGWCRPSLWDRGFPAVVKFPSLLAWKRASGDVYGRVPVVGTKVHGRRPNHYYYHEYRPGPSEVYREYWSWRNADIYSGSREPANITPAVYKYLSKEEFATEQAANEAVQHAFTDAGRVACGLTPRHKKLHLSADKI
jgi:uncharacterized protein (TIGR02996 family)